MAILDIPLPEMLPFFLTGNVWILPPVNSHSWANTTLKDPPSPQMTLDFQIDLGFAAGSITVKSLGSTTAKPFSYPYIEHIFAVKRSRDLVVANGCLRFSLFSLDLLMTDETRFIGVSMSQHKPTTTQYDMR